MYSNSERHTERGVKNLSKIYNRLIRNLLSPEIYKFETVNRAWLRNRKDMSVEHFQILQTLTVTRVILTMGFHFKNSGCFVDNELERPKLVEIGAR